MLSYYLFKQTKHILSSKASPHYTRGNKSLYGEFSVRCLRPMQNLL